MNHQIGLERAVVIIPAYNEADRIGPVIEAAQSTHHGLIGRERVIVVDNNSTDGTGAIARNLGVLVLGCERQGKGHAMRIGARYAIQEMGARVLTFADGDAIGLVPEHLEALSALVLMNLTPMSTGYLGERPRILQPVYRHWSGFSGFRAIDVHQVWNHLQAADFEEDRIEGAINAVTRHRSINSDIVRVGLLGLSHVGQLDKQPNILRGIQRYAQIYSSAARGLMSRSGRQLHAHNSEI